MAPYLRESCRQLLNSKKRYIELTQFGKLDIRKLSRTDRRRSEIVVKVEEGSSSYIMALIDILNWMSKGKMTPQPTITLVALSTVLGAGWYAKEIINNREEARKEAALAETDAKLKIALSESGQSAQGSSPEWRGKTWCCKNLSIDTRPLLSM